jgi:hypothetical protein
MRRLITLISAGRNRRIVIRRELPLTEDAGWVQAPYRTKVWRVLRSVRRRPVSVTVAAKSIIGSQQASRLQPAIPSSKVSVLHRYRDQSRPSKASLREALTGGGDALRREQRGWQAHCSDHSGGRALFLSSLLRLNRDCPNEAQQLAADGGHDLALVLASCQQLFVARVPQKFPPSVTQRFPQANIHDEVRRGPRRVELYFRQEYDADERSPAQADVTLPGFPAPGSCAVSSG